MQTIDEYLDSVKPEQRAEFERIRNIVHKATPETTETMSYGVPTFKYRGKNLLHFGAFKHHMSIFPGSHAIEILQDRLIDYKIARGTIKYTNQQLISETLVIELLAVGIADIDAGV